MPDQDAPYDPYIPSGGQPAQGQAGGNPRTQALQAVSEKPPRSRCERAPWFCERWEKAALQHHSLDNRRQSNITNISSPTEMQTNP